MHPLLDVRPWPRALLQYPLLILSAILLGGALAFAYSYAPLHRAKDWEISYLQERLQSRSEQIEKLEEQLRAAETTLEGQPSNEQLSALQAQLDEANGLTGSLQQQIRDLEWKLTKMTRSRDSWKQKHADLAARAATPKPAAPVPAADPEPDARIAGSPVPEGGAEPQDDTTPPAAPAGPAPDDPTAP